MLSSKQKFELLYQTCAIATRKILVVQLRGEHYRDETRMPDYRKMYVIYSKKQHTFGGC